MLIDVLDLGVVSFQEAYLRQIEIHGEVVAGRKSNTLILCQHPHTITLSRKASVDNILDKKIALSPDVDFIIGVDRGGDVTYHGPGQLMGYLIFDLRSLQRDLGLFLDRTEELIINTLSKFGITGLRRYGFRGVWLGEEKIASIGIGVKKWVTLHGFGLNVNTDLKFFDLIRPCGMNIKMTSMKDVLDKDIDLDLVKNELIKELNLSFEPKACVH